MQPVHRDLHEVMLYRGLVRLIGRGRGALGRLRRHEQKEEQEHSDKIAPGFEQGECSRRTPSTSSGASASL